MLHEPAAPCGEDYASEFKTRLGVWMFIVYAIIYSGFVVINLLKPVLMEREIVLGLNLAVVYGFGLIIVALAMAMSYSMICSRKERILAAAAKESEVK